MSFPPAFSGLASVDSVGLRQVSFFSVSVFSVSVGFRTFVGGLPPPKPPRIMRGSASCEMRIETKPVFRYLSKKLAENSFIFLKTYPKSRHCFSRRIRFRPHEVRNLYENVRNCKKCFKNETPKREFHIWGLQLTYGAGNRSNLQCFSRRIRFRPPEDRQIHKHV